MTYRLFLLHELKCDIELVLPNRKCQISVEPPSAFEGFMIKVNYSPLARRVPHKALLRALINLLQMHFQYLQK